MTQIIPFQASINTCYILKDKGVVLVDAAIPGRAKSFSQLLARHKIMPEEIQLIIPTHGDFDHAGGAKELKELTGAKIVMHEKDKDNLEQSTFHWPGGVTGWGKISRTMMIPFVKKMVKFPAEKVDIVIGDDGLSLKEYGIPGKIVYTPGHTYGSISVILDSGDAFVGCLAHNRFPFVLKPKLPIYAMDLELLKKSWTKVINLGAKTIYPGHGSPFEVEKIVKYLN
ncbi:MAG: MBL fold metallo-hydrolase [Bacteroidota bacterium]|nr:MBL fold metallo-hydrolase [Bacteroidota bacterium]